MGTRLHRYRGAGVQGIYPGDEFFPSTHTISRSSNYFTPFVPLYRNHEVRDGVLYIPYLREEDLGEYVCSAQNEAGIATGVVELNTGTLVPYFQQNPVSYIEYPKIEDAYLQFDIEISFKPEMTDGEPSLYIMKKITVP